MSVPTSHRRTFFSVTCTSKKKKRNQTSTGLQKSSSELAYGITQAEWHWFCGIASGVMDQQIALCFFFLLCCPFSALSVRAFAPCEFEIPGGQDCELTLRNC